MITCKIDVTKIEKERLFKGEKGTYLDIVLIETTNNQYGDDYMIVQSVSKEESAQGVRGKILGNARIVKPKTQAGQSATQELATTKHNIEPDNDLPF